MIFCTGAAVRVISSCLIATLAIAGISTPAAAADADPVRLDVGLTGLADPAAVVAALGDDVLDSDPVPGLDAITVDVPADRSAAVRAALTARTDVRYAEIGGLVLPYSDPYDQANLARLNTMSIPDAWEVTTGSEDIVVAMVDSGVTPNADLGADRLTARLRLRRRRRRSGGRRHPRHAPGERHRGASERCRVDRHLPALPDHAGPGAADSGERHRHGFDREPRGRASSGRPTTARRSSTCRWAPWPTANCCGTRSNTRSGRTRSWSAPRATTSAPPGTTLRPSTTSWP
nr:hypothetical protein GCM10020092_106670 [Actinoplanes digitatis]